MSRPSPARDPRRSLIAGTIIAGMVLAILTLIVAIGIFIVFYPRRGGRDSLGPLRPRPAIHLIAPATS